MSTSILIVDDDRNVIQALHRLLRQDGYEILTAENGEEALRLLRERDVSVIICDQRMPGMSGAQVLAEAVKLRPNTRRITLTGYTDLAAAQASINQGRVHHFMLKPWDDEALRELVRDHARTRANEIENQRLHDLTQRQREELERVNRTLEEQVRERTNALQRRNEELEELRKQLEQSLRDTVAVLAGVLEAYSPALGLHCKRVAQTARILAQRMQVPDSMARDIEFAAYLHDIGRVAGLAPESSGTPDAFLAEHFTGGERFCQIGARMLERIKGFEEAAQGVCHQLECFDGSGAPDGMRGEDIPLAARVVAVADAYDSAVYSQAHPTAVERSAGREMLERGKGTRFDPLLVNLLLEHIESVGVEQDGDPEVEVVPKQLEAEMVLSRDLRNGDGVLLLKAGTRLSLEHVAHVRRLALTRQMDGGVFVRCDKERASALNADSDVAESQTTSEENEAPSDSDADGVRIKRILVVDDVVMICNALTRELRQLGWETVAVDNGRAAQNLLETERFDAIITDVVMPLMSGEALVAHAGQCWPDIPCIVLTGHAQKEQLKRIAALPNVADIMSKPWDRDRLITSLSIAMANATRKNEETSPVATGRA